MSLEAPPTEPVPSTKVEVALSREKLWEDMAEYEARKGKVETTPSGPTGKTIDEQIKAIENSTSLHRTEKDGRIKMLRKIKNQFTIGGK